MQIHSNNNKTGAFYNKMCIRDRAENELANTYISEVGLYDADGDMVAMKAFLKKGKDADMECVFECDDTF